MPLPGAVELVDEFDNSYFADDVAATDVVAVAIELLGFVGAAVEIEPVDAVSRNECVNVGLVGLNSLYLYVVVVVVGIDCFYAHCNDY